MRLRGFLVTSVALAVAASPVAAHASASHAGSYRFFKPGSTASKPGAYWNPCSVIHYGIDFGYAEQVGLRKSWELQRWKSVVQDYQSAMNVKFLYTGEVATRASGQRPVGGPELVITFGNAKSSGRYGYGKALRGPVAGVAGIVWSGTSGTGAAQVKRGYVVIDAKAVSARAGDAPDPRPASERSPDIVRALYLHEFGHAVGLDHVSDRTQLMYPQLIQTRPDSFGEGDAAGLRTLGRQRCF